MKSLKDVKVGETATVVKLHGEGATKRRIMDMGITKGVEIHVRKVAPLGDPMELNVRGYECAEGRRGEDRGLLKRGLRPPLRSGRPAVCLHYSPTPVTLVTGVCAPGTHGSGDFRQVHALPKMIEISLFARGERTGKNRRVFPSPFSWRRWE